MKKILIMMSVLILIQSISYAAKPKEINLRSKKIRQKEENLNKKINEYNKKQENKVIKVNSPIKESQEIEGVFKDLDINNSSGLTEDDFKLMLKGTEMEGIEKALAKSDSEIGVNGLFMISLASLESGFGKSKLAKERNNLTGFSAYDNDINKAKYFDSFSDCIIHTATYLKENYLNKDGKYYTGNTISDLNRFYSTSNTWSTKINKLMERYLKVLKLNSERKVT